MFSQSNILPQVTQIGFAPQGSPIQPVNAFQTALQGQQILSAPLQRDMQREQIQHMREGRELNRLSIQMREQELDFRREQQELLNAQQIGKMYDEVASTRNDILGFSFVNPENEAIINEFFEENNITEDRLSALTGQDPVQVTQFRNEMMSLLNSPEIQRVMKAEEGFRLLMDEYRSKPDNYDHNAVATALEMFSTGEPLSESDFNPANFVKQQNPETRFLETWGEIAEGGVDPNQPELFEEFSTRAKELGLHWATSDEAVRARYDGLFSLGIPDESYAYVAETMLGPGASEEEKGVMLNILQSSLNTTRKVSGKAAAMDQLNGYIDTALKVNAANRKSVFDANQRIRVNSSKQTQSGRTTRTSTSSIPSLPLTSSGAINLGKTHPNLDLTSPSVSTVVETKTKTKDVPGIKYTPKGRTDGNEVGVGEIKWSDLTVEQVNELLLQDLTGQNKAFALDEGMDINSFILNQRLLPTNNMPVYQEELGQSYSQYNGSLSIRYSDGDLGSFDRDENSVYFKHNGTGRVLTNDINLAISTNEDAWEYINDLPATLNENSELIKGVLQHYLTAKTVYDGKGNPIDTLFAVDLASTSTFSTNANLQSLQEPIISAEAGEAGYNAYNFGEGMSSSSASPPLGDEFRLTDMTLGQVLGEIDRYDGGAVGAYQFRGKTLREGMNYLGYSEDTRFSPDVQDDLFHNYIMTGKKRPKIKEYIRNGFIDGKPATKEDAAKELANEFAIFKGEGGLIAAADYVEGYRNYYQSKQNLAAEILSDGPQTKNAGTIMGYSGNTGYSTNPHIDIRMVDPETGKPNGVRPSESILNSVMVGGKQLSSHRQSRGMLSDHPALDYAIPPLREIQVEDNLVKSAQLRLDSKGIGQPDPASKKTSGGIYLDITTNDGERFYLMHLDPMSVDADAPAAPPAAETQEEESTTPSIEIPQQVRDKYKKFY